MGAFKAGDGRVRSGWVVLAFVLLAAATWLAVAVPTFAVAVALLSRSDPSASLETLMRVDSADTWQLLVASLPAFSGAVAASLATHLLFKEQVGLARERAPVWLLRGLGLGLAALTLAVGVPALVGAGTLRLTTLPALSVLGAVGLHAVVLAPQAVAEELLLRGVPLRALSRGLHPVVAAVLTSGTFGVLHLNNPNASWVAALNVALVGLWFAALTLRTGSLWCSIGLHVAWNFCEGVVYGQPISGLSPGRSLFVATWPAEAGFWTGGGFGPEASGWTSVLLVLATAATALWPGSGARLPRPAPAPAPAPPDGPPPAP